MVEAIDFCQIRLGESIDNISTPTTHSVVSSNADQQLVNIEESISKIQCQLNHIEEKVKFVQKS